MKLLFGFVIVSLALVAYGQRTTFEMSPMDWVAYSANIFYNIPVAAKKDLLLYLDDSAENTVMAIRRRDNTGQYRHVANFTELTSPFFTTNGKWIASSGEGTTLVSIDASNELSEVSYLMTYGGFLLSDDTFVGFDPVSETGDGNFTFRSFEYNSAIKNWTEIAGTGLTVTTGVQYTGDVSTYRVIDTHLVFLDDTQPDNYTVHIYERQADKSWSLSDSVSVNSTYPGSVNYNGVDTLVYSMPVVEENDVIGLFFLHTKVNGQWVQQKFNGANLDYRPMGIIGFTTIFIDADTLFVTAGAEGFAGGGPDQTLNGGKVLMMTRNAQGLWEPSIDLVGTRGLVGLGLAINDYDIIAPSLTGATNGIETTYFTAPICFTQPINVTCSNQQVNNCSDLSIAELYTINNPQCGAVTASLKGLSLVNNQALSAEFTFTRGYGEDFSCSATVTCPAPPVAPVSNNNNNVNGANVLSLGLASVLVSVAIMLL